jgi:hypothetical protein
MDKQYKPLTPPDKKAYEPYVKPKFVDDTTPTKAKKHFKAKPSKPKPLVRLCEKCHNVISLSGDCDICGHHSVNNIYTSVLL